MIMNKTEKILFESKKNEKVVVFKNSEKEKILVISYNDDFSVDFPFVDINDQVLFDKPELLSPEIKNWLQDNIQDVKRALI